VATAQEVQVTLPALSAAEEVAQSPRALQWLTRHAGRLIVLTVLFGMGCRLAQYAARISFWHDEASIVLNVEDKTARQLMGPLDQAQTAPPLFLLALRACYVTMGGSEYSLRLVPEALGLAALPLFAWLTWRRLSPLAALAAVVLLALSPTLISRCAEVKQYTGDILAAVTMTAMALLMRRPASPTMRLALFALVTAAVMWWSEPVIFVFGGISLAMLPSILRGGRPTRRLLAYLAANLPALLSFAILYHLSMRVQQCPQLYDYWVDKGMLVDYSRWMYLPLWLLRRVVQLCDYAYEPWGPVVALLAIAGAVALRRRREWGGGNTLAILLAPVALTMLAGLLRQYPFGGARVTAFLTPGVVMLAAVGLEGLLRQRRWKQLRLAGGVAGLVLIMGGAAPALYHLAVPRNDSHIRPAVAYVRQHRLPGDLLCPGTYISWIDMLCYWRRPDPPVVELWDPAAARKAHRFWLIVEFAPDQGLRKRQALLDEASKIGRQRDAFIANGGAAFLFESPDAPER
jgi:hypothetical protein